MSTKKGKKFAYVKYCTGEKEIISVDRIKGFNAKNIRYDQKYKIFWNDIYYDGIIIYVAESEEILEAKIEQDRPRLRPMDQYISASESDAENKENKKNKDGMQKDNCEKGQLLRKKLEDASKKQYTTSDNNTETKENREKEKLLVKKHKESSSHKQSNKEVEKSNEEVGNVKECIAKLQRSLEEKYAIIEDYVQKNFAFQQNMKEEIQDLKRIIKEQSKEETDSKEEGTLFPIGYQRKHNDNVQIHIGRNIWIASQVYDSILCISKSPSLFIKNMALAIFGAQVLQESSVTGTVSNKIKRNKNIPPRPKLDPQRVLALKDILRYWRSKVKKCDELIIDLEVNLVGKYISQKIYELNRAKNKQSAVYKNIEVPESASTVEEHVDEKTDDEAITNENIQILFNIEDQDEESNI